MSHYCTHENAPKFLEWIRNRGGVAVWRSVNLSNPGASWSTPALDLEGKPYPKPTWEADSKPEAVFTNPADIIVTFDKEVKRFHVAVRMGGQGFMVKVTEASSHKIHKAVEKAGKGAYYRFDYDTQEAVIYVPVREITLEQWTQEQEVKA